MKKKKLWWLVAGLAFGLIGLLVFQIRWLLASAELKENQFQHRVTMALCAAADELGKDRQVCSALASCSVRQGSGLVEFVGLKNSHHIEQVVGDNLIFYQVDTPFEVTLSNAKNPVTGSYAQAKIKNTSNAAIHVDFPSRQDFILSELNGMFITSFLLIGLLILVCAVALRWMFKQQKIQAETVHYIDAMSHELKTPVNNISLALAMIERQVPMDQSMKIRQYMEVAKEENESLKEKINDVLGTASIEKLLGRDQKSVCPIHDLIRETQKRMSVRIEELNANVRVELSAVEDVVYGDSKELLNVLICLLDNALTYTEKAPVVRVTTSNHENQIMICVQDNGVGIPGDMHAQIFEKYFRKNETKPGYGIGLFLAKNIIESHGGSIHLESDPDKGTKFIIVLPLTE